MHDTDMYGVLYDRIEKSPTVLAKAKPIRGFQHSPALNLGQSGHMHA